MMTPVPGPQPVKRVGMSHEKQIGYGGERTGGGGGKIGDAIPLVLRWGHTASTGQFPVALVPEMVGAAISLCSSSSGGTCGASVMLSYAEGIPLPKLASETLGLMDEETKASLGLDRYKRCPW